MNIQAYIKSNNQLNNQQVENNVTWATVVQQKIPEKVYRGKGEMPYLSGSTNKNHRNFTANENTTKRKMNKPPSSEEESFVKENNSEIKENTLQQEGPQFHQITPRVREVVGGWNTQSNEVIEKRYRQRQSQNVEEDGSSEYTTASSETNDSFKTALQYSFEKMKANQELINKKILQESSIDRYKRNALIAGLIKDSLNFCDPEDVDEIESNEESGDFYINTPLQSIVHDTANLQVQEKVGINENQLMQGDRLGRLFQSEEDEDVYVHPLKEQIKKDPEWQKYRLSRKGTETVFTPREYYLNIDNDSFVFEKPQS